MKKGISFFYGFNTNPHIKAKKIKLAGFDHVMTSAQFDSLNGTIAEQIELFKQNNLKISSLHMKYNNDELPSFWQKSKIGDKIENDIISDLIIAKKYSFLCVVVHLCGIPNKIGLERIKRILSFCKKINIPIALENLNENDCLFYVFKNIDNKYLRFCYDSGHNHCFDPEVDYLTIFADKLICLHLHDNLGKFITLKDCQNLGLNKINPDLHTLNKYGNINWHTIAEKLAKINQEIFLDYELLFHGRKNETEEDVLNETYKQALELEKMIYEEKQKLNNV